MHVLVIGINYWPEETGIAVFTTGRCEYLASRGHRVTMCTSFPYYPSWRTMDPYRGRIITKERRNGVDIHRTWMYVPRHVTSLRRILHESSFVASCFASTMVRRRPDLIFVVSPPLGLAVLAVGLSLRWRVPYMFHVADLQPDAAVDLGMLRSKQMLKGLYALERIAYRNAARVSTLTNAMRDKIIRKGIAPEKVALVPDWSEPALFTLPLSNHGEDFRRKYNIGTRFIVSHSGNMGVKQGLEVVLGAAELAQTKYPELLFLLVGDGAMKQKLQQSTAARRLENVLFVPILQPQSFHQMLAASDLCLITQQRSVSDIVFPSKVLTLLSAGRPILASLSEGSEIARVLRDAGAGLRTEAQDPTALLDGVLKLRALPWLRAQMGVNGRSYAQHHWEKGRALKMFENCMIGPRPAFEAAAVNVDPNQHSSSELASD
jgi:colanic acid biosynthesis glycosyl transferase WcaI